MSARSTLPWWSPTTAATRLRPRPEPRCRAALVETIEAGEHVLALLGGHAWAVIADRDLEMAVRAAERELDSALRRCVLERVVEKIGHRLKEHVPVAWDDDAGRVVQHELLASLFDQWCVELGDVVDDRGEVDILEGSAPLTRFDACDPEKRAKSREQPVGLFDRFVDFSVGTRLA